MDIESISDVRAQKFICAMLDEDLEQCVTPPLTEEQRLALDSVVDLYTKLIFSRKITKVSRNKIRVACGKKWRSRGGFDPNEVWSMLWVVSSYGLKTNGRDVLTFQRIAVSLYLSLSYARAYKETFSDGTWFEDAWEEAGVEFKESRDWKKAKQAYDSRHANVCRAERILREEIQLEFMEKLSEIDDRVPL